MSRIDYSFRQLVLVKRITYLNENKKFMGCDRKVLTGEKETEKKRLWDLILKLIKEHQKIRGSQGDANKVWSFEPDVLNLILT